MRPKAQEVLEYPLFWTFDKRFSFLRDAYDHILELEDSKVFNALENTVAESLARNCDEDWEVTFLNSIGTGSGSSKFDTATDLLWLIKNTSIYHAQLPQAALKQPKNYWDHFLKHWMIIFQANFQNYLLRFTSCSVNFVKMTSSFRNTKGAAA
ncbi:hypothetical protein SLE2022_266890 [Rubroshorea leprosula]